MKLMIAFGTRPEYIKVEPIIQELYLRAMKPTLLWVKQHKDIEPLAYYRPLTIDVPEGGNRLNAIIYGVIGAGIPDDITHVLVQGDTTTALAVALWAFNHGKKIIHLEAGLRTYDKDNPWPEESNRRMISTFADVNLCPTDIDEANLITEGVPGDIYVTGNTSIDNLLAFEHECEYTNIILVTMHRRENHSRMREWFTQIEGIAIDNPHLKFILPIHHNPDVRRHRGVFNAVNVIDPIPHGDLLNLLVRARMVITDSGGIQEESSFFNKKCLVCRKTTERKSSLGQSSYLVPFPTMLRTTFDIHIDDYEIDFECPYGDGRSSLRIVEILKTI